MMRRSVQAWRKAGPWLEAIRRRDIHHKELLDWSDIVNRLRPLVEVKAEPGILETLAHLHRL
jgi:hypothetical protein